MTDKKEYRGLDNAAVEASRRKHGANILTPAKRRSAFARLLDKFKEPLIIVLMVAGALSLAISCYDYWGLGLDAVAFFEPVGIFIAIILATGLGFIFEERAEREFAILNKVNDDEPVEVYRNGAVTEVPRRDIVVGDIVVLTTGCEIPADGRLLAATSVTVDESTLTGEPQCSKTTNPAEFHSEATYPSDVVLRGTRMLEGHGIMEVESVGDTTESGKVFCAAGIDSSVKTPLNEQLERLGRFIARASYVIGALVVVGRMIMYFHQGGDASLLPMLTYFLQTLMIAVTLIVVSVPEGLPMAVTLSLAYSMRRMLRTSNLVRKMHACETMGATTVICTDKTGTLTENRMQVAHTDFFGSPSDKVIFEGIAVNSTAELDMSDASGPKVIGNPTEGALLLWLHRRGVDYRATKSAVDVVAEVPFSTERKYMATVVADGGGKHTLFIKGAPEIVYAMCGVYPAGAGREEIEGLLTQYQNQGMRTLGFAYKELADGEMPVAPDGKIEAPGIVFLGVAAISDPVRADVPAAVAEVLSAGIGVKIVTGDTPATAREIGRQIGLWNDATDCDDNIITGTEFAELTDEELRGRVGRIKIIARARPMDKKRLVESLQALGEVVAVTGDGTNDAPALKAAHVGLSMGDGTSVAKEASDITIIDNSFASIGRAVMWGRSLYRNIQRFVLFQMTVNVVACLIVLCGAFLGTESPLTVTQMLWVNLIMDTFAAMALASLPPSASVMGERPRDRRRFIITPSMWRSIIVTGLLMFGMLICMFIYLGHTDLLSLADIGRVPLTAEHMLTPYEVSLFFTVFVFLQFWNMFNARAYATNRSALHFGNCGGFLLIAAIIFGGQILIVSVGGPFFSVMPLRLTDWLLIIGGTSIVLWIGELWRLVRVGLARGRRDIA